ncbi:MAG: Unknown protein [uncultured Aureispira sp.]|uniref:Uncharacterized protein n=1 Tax=uncultured Aureispira sp. TaxID=1331704 RepID=A0A6S6UHT7_9BACT|nr:MAG: Unknown protein [uncultured Aureispira sp.]
MSTTPATNLDFSVIVTNKNHIDFFQAFARALGLSVELLGEAAFKEIHTWKKDALHAFFSKKGTLLCIPSGEYNIAAASRDSQVAFLDISKNASTFNLEYAENGSMQRMYTNFNGIVRRNIKAPLQWENANKTYLEVVSDAILALTGQTLDAYQKQTATRYRIIK